MEINSLLSRFKKVKKNSANSWMCLCSSHDDKSASLKITQGKDGRVLINCFAGCPPGDVLGAVGLTIDDLFEKPLYHRAKGIKGTNVYPREVLTAIVPELMLFLLASFTLKKGNALAPVDQERLELSYSRLMYALELAEIA